MPRTTTKPVASGTLPTRTKDSLQSVDAHKAPKSSSFAENRGYNKFIPLNNIATNVGTHARAAPGASTSMSNTPASETPLPRYTPTLHANNASSFVGHNDPRPRAQSYFPAKSKAAQLRATKRTVTLSYVVPQKATTHTCSPLTPTLGGPELSGGKPRTPPSASSQTEPVNKLVATVLSKLKLQSPELTCTSAAGLRPLILPHELENRTPSPTLAPEPSNMAMRPLLLPQQSAISARAALRVSALTIARAQGVDLNAMPLPPHVGIPNDNVSVRSMSVYSQMSWEAVPSSTSLACTAGSEHDLNAFDEVGLYPALRGTSPGQKRRAICMPEWNGPGRF